MCFGMCFGMCHTTLHVSHHAAWLRARAFLAYAYDIKMATPSSSPPASSSPSSSAFSSYLADAYGREMRWDLTWKHT